VHDLKARLANCAQLSTDGPRVYLSAVDVTVGDAVDVAMIHTLYGPDEGNTYQERNYSPNVFTEVEVKIIKGDPDPREISTSYVERHNLAMRIGMRRFTRPTYGFSRKVENLAHAVGLHYMYYNFAQDHKSLTVGNADGTKTKRTPAMAAGVADHKWSLREIAALLDADETDPLPAAVIELAVTCPGNLEGTSGVRRRLLNVPHMADRASACSTFEHREDAFDLPRNEGVSGSNPLGGFS
jgi:hypothetical protein